MIQQIANLTAQLETVRNFPAHVGSYDAELPDKQCAASDYHGKACFRDGWACAVNAINEKITKTGGN